MALSRGGFNDFRPPLGKSIARHVSMVRYRMEMIHIHGESWRAYLHFCTCRRGRTGDFRETRKAPRARAVLGFSQFLGGSLGAFWHFLEAFLTTTSSPLRKWYIPTCQLDALSNDKGYISMANPGGCTSMSAHVGGVSRGIFGKRGKCGAFWIFRNFRRNP